MQSDKVTNYGSKNIFQHFSHVIESDGPSKLKEEK